LHDLHDFKKWFAIFWNKIIFATSKVSRGVIGNTSDSGSEEWEFETLRDNHNAGSLPGIFILIPHTQRTLFFPGFPVINSVQVK
jgi:hypothetical protein